MNLAASGVSVIVPVYNSEQSLAPLVDQLQVLFARLGCRFEVILVDDGSRDTSWDVIQQLSERFTFVHGIRLMRNYGQHNALLCGIRCAAQPVIVTVDDDLQNPPEEIPKLLAKLDEGFDVVYGYPEKEAHGVLRKLASQITKLAMQTAMGVQAARRVSAFRAFRTTLRNAFADYRSSYVSVDVLLTWGTSKFTAIRVRHEPRRFGASNYSLPKLIMHAVNMMTGFSSFPLQLASVVGFSLSAFGACVLTYVIGRYFISGSVVPGFPFLASVICILSGAQLFALGVIGEYLARVHFRLMDRPSYVRAEGATSAVPEQAPERSAARASGSFS